MIEYDYWRGMVLCKRKALSHIQLSDCVSIHSLEVCGACPHFLNILRAQQCLEIDEIVNPEPEIEKPRKVTRQ